MQARSNASQHLKGQINSKQQAQTKSHHTSQFKVVMGVFQTLLCEMVHQGTISVNSSQHLCGFYLLLYHFYKLAYILMTRFYNKKEEFLLIVSY